MFYRKADVFVTGLRRIAKGRIGTQMLCLVLDLLSFRY